MGLKKSFIDEIKEKISSIRGVLSVHIDVGSLINASAEAHVLLHEAVELEMQLMIAYKRLKLDFEVWESDTYQTLKAEYKVAYIKAYNEWDIGPRGSRPPRPEEVKETEIKHMIRASKEYKTRQLGLIQAEYYYKLVSEAYVEPIKSRIMMIMSLNKSTAVCPS